MAKKRDRKTKKTTPARPPAPAGAVNRRQRLADLLFPALLVGLQVGLVSVWNVYRGNQAEFDHGLIDLAPFFLAVALILFSLFWILPVLLPGRRHVAATAFVTMLGLLLYVQGNFLVWDYGVFDGGQMRWADHQAKGWLELALWLGALTWAVWRSAILYRQARFICLALIVLPLGYLAVAAVNSDEGFWRREGSFADTPPAEIYRYSQHRNVVHLLLDAFQTDVFEELVAEEDLAGELEGFTLYRDNLGVAAHTSFALPAIFSGEIFDGQESPSAYYARCIGELGFQNVLYDAGYRVNLLPRLGMDKGKHHHHFRVPNTFGGSQGFRRRQAAGQLLDVGLFRLFPHPVKKWLYNDGQWRVSGLISTPPTHRSIHQRAFFRDYIARLEPGFTEPAYHFIHIMSPHPPYGTMADGSPSPDPMPLTRESYKHEARFSLRVFLDLLDRLRSLGLYEDALIILQGDHGSDYPPVVGGRTVVLPADRTVTLLAIKAPGSTGPLVTSEAPSSIADLPATLAALLDLGHPFPGQSLLEMEQDFPRTRRFFQYLGSDRDQATLRRFAVTGSIFDPGNWRELASAEVVQDVGVYTWGDVIEFGMEGNADPFTGRGWAAPLSNGQWSDGDSAHLILQVAAPGEDVDFLLAMRPFLVPGKLDRQRVRILVGGAHLTTLDVNEPQAKLYKLTIPASMLTSDEVHLTFGLPDAAIPAELGVSGDRRKLGISVISVCLFPQSLAEEIIRKTRASRPRGGPAR
jgi:hypothetical protein